jgi:hypothetical protein
VHGLWFAGSSLAVVEPKFAMGNENQSLGAQSQVLCSNTVLKKQPSIKKLPHTVSGLSGKCNLLQRSELRNHLLQRQKLPSLNACRASEIQRSRQRSHEWCFHDRVHYLACAVIVH